MQSLNIDYDMNFLEEKKIYHLGEDKCKESVYIIDIKDYSNDNNKKTY